MSVLSDKVAEVAASEKALKDRVQAHEDKFVETITALNVEIKALQDAGTDEEALAGLNALKADLEAFDPDPVVVTEPTTEPVVTAEDVAA